MYRSHAIKMIKSFSRQAERTVPVHHFQHVIERLKIILHQAGEQRELSQRFYNSSKNVILNNGKFCDPLFYGFGVLDINEEWLRRKLRVRTIVGCLRQMEADKK